MTGPLVLTDLVRYQGAGGDMNPSHHDADFAKQAGSPGAFAPGLLSAALLADWATSWLGAENVRKFGVRFRSQVWLGDELTCSGEIAGVREEDGQPIADVELACRNQDGAVVTAGWASFVLV